MKKCKVLLFNDFETLDVFGPVEVLAYIKDIDVELSSITGGLIKAYQGYEVKTTKLDNSPFDILLVPGGQGTRQLVDDSAFLAMLDKQIELSEFVLSVCTGAALLAKTNWLDNKAATTNKQAFKWVSALNSTVLWRRRARWVVDSPIYTSSGVSAGIDMTLGFIAEQYGYNIAKEIANSIEYIWNEDAEQDFFAVK
ncbi:MULTISPECIES: DJ-1/PfpI family protein [unclassified Enterococcus]|uniref:DJ-1/PfpI family protein n=1 Tax=unclassified Enterococcus TaxID=2608891 RepID=UPI001553A2DA|nr:MULTISPECIES: DJ-1/PfpI family protein [unclassified Enterococcus]MBS7576602.1 DJ-1/PfpI family protein [Enterococcus sp. MMGLQ5-2]MBS7583911.1 DJ-1/PfpI family protein [Enterococcus sp. MMGLQ5-1]NPD11772.1 DJ-1/PfpI family protein [Enterococcus sp. MMGLQ5-1]NPD36439.1 DJ-1/PfpI family protein [Enterococcus sp. MMGLQ5-2]